MRIKPNKLMRFGDKGRLAEALPSDWVTLLAYNRRDIESCGGWDWIQSWLLSLILWWIDQDPKQAEVWNRRYIAIRDIE